MDRVAVVVAVARPQAVDCAYLYVRTVRCVHILFNMLWLYWFGRFFLVRQYSEQAFRLSPDRRFGGAALYLAAIESVAVFPRDDAVLIGSSASVIAIVVATAWRMPEYRVGLLFIGQVALKWIAAFTVLLSLLNIPGENAGGNTAHLGGALAGMAYGIAMGRGHDITRPVNVLIDRIVDVWKRLTALKSKESPRSIRNDAAPRGTQSRTADRADMDSILDKIKKSGYSSLTADERKRLFDVSRRIK